MKLNKKGITKIVIGFILLLIFLVVMLFMYSDFTSSFQAFLDLFK